MSESLITVPDYFDSKYITVKIDDGNLVNQYGILATDLSITEGETAFTTTTTGGDVYIYCTGQKPVTISVSGCIVFKIPNGTECKDPEKDFHAFYAEKRIGKSGSKPLTIKVGEATYSVCLTDCTRNGTSTPTELHTFNLKFVGVYNE